MLIDDNSYYIKQTNENFPQDGRIFVLPDYKYFHGLQNPNIYHVKTTVSDLKDEDFTKAAAKEKTMTDNNINKQIDAKSILL